MAANNSTRKSSKFQGHRGSFSRRLKAAAIFSIACMIFSPRASVTAQAAPADAGAGARYGLPYSHISSTVASSTRVGRVPSDTTIPLTLVLPLRNQDQLSDLLQRAYDPNDPNFGIYLTQPEFVSEFGPAPQDLGSVEAFAAAHGLAITGASDNRTMLEVTGSDAAVENAFGIALNEYVAPDGHAFHAPDREPTVTPDVAGKLLAVVGLDDSAVSEPADLRPDQLIPDDEPLFDTDLLYYSGPYGLTPDDVRKIYDLPRPSFSFNGQGQTLALVEFDTYHPSDIKHFEAAYTGDLIDLENISVDGFNTNQTPGANVGEVTLDIEMMASLAPMASHILVYENTDGSASGHLDVYDKIAAENRAKEISTSWLFRADALTPGELCAENQCFEQMAAQGQSFFAASGDGGAYADQNDIGHPDNLSVNDPASEPFVTGVGGTNLTDTRFNQYVGESAWSDRKDTSKGPIGTGGGGGIDKHWDIPWYQVGAVDSYSNPQVSSTMRNVPDVSLFGDYDTGEYSVYLNGRWNGLNGTSAAAPLWAAFTALVNQGRDVYRHHPIGFLNPAVYALARNHATYSRDFHDAQGGNNLYYNCVEGYDNATGLGSFVGENLLRDLVDWW